MRTAKLFPFLSMFLAAMSPLIAGELPPCSAHARCFTIAHRENTAALAVDSPAVAAVYRNGHLLKRATDYDIALGATKPMVIVHMPANTTDKAEHFQVNYSR